jgi:hypothetical protein
MFGLTAMVAGACADLVGIPDRYYNAEGGGVGGADGGAPDGASDGFGGGDDRPPGDDGTGPSDGARDAAGGDGSGPYFPPDAGCPACIDSGLCQIACNQNHPTSIAVDSAHVYWTNIDDAPATFTGGSVMQVDKSGANLTTISGPLSTRPITIVASGGCVYWYEIQPGAVNKWCGSLSNVISNLGQGVPSIAVAGNTLVWSSGGTSGSVARCTLPACSSTSTIAGNRQVSAFGLTLDSAATTVYWLEGTNTAGSVLSCPVSGCGASAPTTVSGVPLMPAGMSIDSSGDIAYTARTAGQSDGEIAYYFPPVGDTSIEARNRPTPTSIVTDKGDIYWIEWGSGSGEDSQIVGCSFNYQALCDPIRILAQHLPYAAKLAVDATRVYWVNSGPPNTPNAGSVMSAPR